MNLYWFVLQKVTLSFCLIVSKAEAVMSSQTHVLSLEHIVKCKHGREAELWLVECGPEQAPFPGLAHKNLQRST